MRDKIQREVERRDRRDDAERHAKIEANASRRSRGIHRHGLAMNALGLLGRERERLDAPGDLPVAYFHALPASRAISAVNRLRESMSSAARRRTPTVCALASRTRPETLARARDGAVDGGGVSNGHLADCLARVFVRRTWSVGGRGVRHRCHPDRGVRRPSISPSQRGADVVQTELVEHPRHGVVHDVVDRAGRVVEGRQRRR